MRRKLAFLVLLFAFGTGVSQERLSISISKTSEKIEVDGALSESVWSGCDVASSFYQQFPLDTSYSETKTEVMLTFDEEFLYIGARCFDNQMDEPFVIQSLKRDFSYPISDAFAVFVDPFDSKQNGFSFAVNPAGVQREGLIENGGAFGVSSAWDNKWFAEVSHHEDRWEVEMKIPFKTLRFDEKLDVWGINFSRNNLKKNENSCWISVPRNFNVASLAFTGELKWNDHPKKVKSNVALIPYVNASGGVDYENQTDFSSTNVGGDAKIAVTSSLNLDLTVNPDFSQVDVDRQVTNLSRFSLFFPERRQFFIENADLFSRFGFRQIRPFFSRRIGLSSGQQIPIVAGARLSGMLDENWRVGLLNMQTEGRAELDLEAQNYTVGVFQRKVGVRSNIAGIVVNRQGFNKNKMDFGDYNRVAGLEFNLASKDGMYMGKAFYHRSFEPNSSDEAHASWFMVKTQNFNAHWNHEYVGKDYRADVGFVPRISQYNQETGEVVYQAYWRLEPSLSYTIYPKNDKINNFTGSVYWNQYFNEDFSFSERNNNAELRLRMTDQSEVKLKAFQDEVMLPFDTDVTFTGGTPIPAGRYLYNHIALSYKSNKFQLFNYEGLVDYGAYYIGQKLTVNTSLGYRVPPKFSLAVATQYNRIDMPEGYSDAEIWLVGPRVDLSFTKKMFFTTFVQYNTQAENVNINARFQYRFKPMSDIFIVYTDNYLPYNFSIKNRALTVKFVYWLNV